MEGEDHLILDTFREGTSKFTDAELLFLDPVVRFPVLPVSA